MLLALTINSDCSIWYDRSSSNAHWRSCNLLWWYVWPIVLGMIWKKQRGYSINFAFVSGHLTLLLNVLLEFTHLVYFNVFELLLIKRLLLLSAKWKATILELSIRNLFFLCRCGHKIEWFLRRLCLWFSHLINRKVR